jgi:murein DD-endopeptidase MepM/ murein hydrolase activator NlpD
MNSSPFVDSASQLSNPSASAWPGGERGGDALPPEQVLGLLTLVASLQGIPSLFSGNISLENLIHSMKDSNPAHTGILSLNSPVLAPVSEDYHPGHPGIDYAAPVGTPIVAVMDGMVIFAGWESNGYGNLIIVENGRMQSWFAHLSRFAVPVGRLVRPGDLLGASGASGYNAGPHLHFEIRLDGIPVDPARFFNRGSIVDENG